jgi:Xaa-Pro aminopeptidase
MLNLERRQQYLNAMTESGWDVLLLYGHSWRKDYFRSLFNFNFFGPHAAALLSRSGEISILFSHVWDYERALAADGTKCKVQLAAEISSGLEHLLTNREGTRLGIAGIELMEARFLESVRRTTGSATASATAVVEKLRRFKTPEEIEIIREAARLADSGYQRFVDVAEPGIAEFELVAEVEAFLKSQGAEDNFMLIASGGVEVYGMKPPTERRLQQGDNVITELSPQVNGYSAQICRTLVLGEPSANQRRSFEIFKEAQQAAQTFLKPGVNISDVARVQNDIFRRDGYGEYTGSKYTRVRGHNLGLHVDDNPYVLEDVDCMVDKGMVLIAHPNTYLPLAGYMVFGDTLVVTADGCVSLNTTEKKLFCK